MDVAIQTLPVARGPYRLYAEVVPGTGVPVVLMHGFPGDLAVVTESVREHFGTDRLVLVAHDASGPPAIDWALGNPGRIETLVLLNTYYHWIPSLRRPRAIALYSTPIVRTGARTIVRRWPDLDRRLYAWQVGTFIRTPRCASCSSRSCMSSSCPPGVLAPQRRPARHGAYPQAAHPGAAPLRPTGPGDLRCSRPDPQPSGRQELRLAVPQQRAAPARRCRALRPSRPASGSG
jgi:pimeloyl-ACP methyl ester carboxylesterase